MSSSAALHSTPAGATTPQMGVEPRSCVGGILTPVVLSIFFDILRSFSASLSENLQNHRISKYLHMQMDICMMLEDVQSSANNTDTSWCSDKNKNLNLKKTETCKVSTIKLSNQYVLRLRGACCFEWQTGQARQYPKKTRV